MVSDWQSNSLQTFIEHLRVAVADLWYPSETDAPLTVVSWPGDQFDSTTLGQWLGRGREPVEQYAAERFFQPILHNPFWQTAAGGHLAQRYQRLQTWLGETLTDLHTYRVGTLEVAVYLVGRYPAGGYVGLGTTVVET
ncbi:MAG TPA: nuclease A inhibitor family protein [Leptolyngbyaceae cyanobacterium M65_K2018_010]|nr:nuclease A inhibitor family protein [Leptolyngbyaceae cyanobacterium M65_K2018_010]